MMIYIDNTRMKQLKIRPLPLKTKNAPRTIKTMHSAKYTMGQRVNVNETETE